MLYWCVPIFNQLFGLSFGRPSSGQISKSRETHVLNINEKEKTTISRTDAKNSEVYF